MNLPPPHRSLTYNTIVFISVSFFLIILITCLAMTPKFQSNEFVWTTYVDYSNWNAPGLVFFFGLVNPSYMFGGIDGALHLSEESPNPSVAIPRALVWTLIIGFVSTFPFIIAMLYCISDLDAVLETPTGLVTFKGVSLADGLLMDFQLQTTNLRALVSGNRL